MVTIETVVRAKAVGLNPLELSVTVVQPDLQTIQVRATYQFIAITPIVGALVGANQWIVGSQATMRVEG